MASTSLLKSLRKITISYNDPDATDSDSDSDAVDLENLKKKPLKRKEIIIWQEKIAQNRISVSGNEDGTFQKCQKQKKLQKEPLSNFLGAGKEECAEVKFPGVRRRGWGKFAAEVRNPFDKKKMWLGTFDSQKMAAKAYQSKKAEFEIILSKMKKKSEKNNVNCSQHIPSSVLDVATLDDIGTTPTNSRPNVAKIADAKLTDTSEEEFDLKKFQDMMYSWYVEDGSEAVAPMNILNTTDTELGTWQPSKKAKLGNDEFIPSSPLLSPILDFEQHLENGNDLKTLGIGEICVPSNCGDDDDVSDLFELEPFPMLFLDEVEQDERNWKQLCEELFNNDYQFSN